MKQGVKVTGCLIAAVLLAWPAWAGQPTPQERGWTIAEEADRRNSGFGDSTANLRMLLRNKQGQTSKRSARSTARCSTPSPRSTPRLRAAPPNSSW